MTLWPWRKALPNPIPPRSIELSRWKQFCLVFLGLTLSGFGGIAAFNLLINPMDFYSTRIIPPIVVNDNKDKQTLLQRMQPAPGVLVLGSSRSMKLDPKVIQELSGLPTFNAATSSASAEDVERMLRLAIQSDRVRPKLVILGVDLEMVKAGEVVLTDGRYEWFQAVQSLSVEQTVLSVRSLRLWSRRVPPRSTRRLDPDGYLHNLVFEDQLQSGRFDLERNMETTMQEYEAYWKKYQSISAERMKLLESVLRLCRAYDIHVISFATPLHPRMRLFLEERGYRSRKTDFEELWKVLCARWNAKYLDLSDPISFGGSPSGFYDGVHVNEANAGLLVRRLLKEEAHAVQ